MAIVRRVHDAVSHWPDFAREVKVPSEMIKGIAHTHRLNLI